MGEILWRIMQKVESEEIQRNQLNPGDHIYTWRPANSKAHHGILVDKRKGEVIHFYPEAAEQKEDGSRPSSPEHINACPLDNACQICDPSPKLSGVVSTCIDNFLRDGKLYRFEYGVSPACFLAKPTGSTCTLVNTYTRKVVKLRASKLLEDGFNVHSHYKNNSEDFAVYCKTGLLSIRADRSTQLAVSLLAVTCAVLFLCYQYGIFTLASPRSWVATGLVIYSTCRLAFDIGACPEVYRLVAVDQLGSDPNFKHNFWHYLWAWMALIFNIWFAVEVAKCIMLFCLRLFQEMGEILRRIMQKVESEEIQRNQLNPGDHIYTWRPANSKAHHGILVDEGKVIHFYPEAAEQEQCSSRPSSPEHINVCPLGNACQICDPSPKLSGVVSTCIDNFLQCGKLYRFEYGVSSARFIAKPRGGTCTLVNTYTHKIVNHRASKLLEDGFNVHSHYRNKSEDFAVYCKTGLLSMRADRSTQLAVSFLAVTCAVLFLCYQYGIFTLASPRSWVATGLVIYSTCRLAFDIGACPEFYKQVTVERLRSNPRCAHKFWHNLRAWMALIFTIWFYVAVEVAKCIMLFCLGLFQKNFDFQRVLFNKITKDQLKRGDHIYTWRGYTYTHHGIYEGKGMVIHLVRGRSPLLRFSCPIDSKSRNYVESIEVEDFLSGGHLYRYEYGVSPLHFIATIRGGVCTLASSDSSTKVINRAKELLPKSEEGNNVSSKKKKKKEGNNVTGRKGIGAYDLLNNNCEDFAIYCKTGTLTKKLIFVGRSGQIISFFAAFCLGPALSDLRVTGTFKAVVVGYCIYSACRVISDTKFRWDACRIENGDFAKSRRQTMRDILFIYAKIFLCVGLVKSRSFLLLAMLFV